MKNLICMILGFILLGSVSAYAKDATLEIEFSFDAEYAPFITEYQLWCIKVPGSAIKVQIGSVPVTDPTVRVLTFDVVDMPPGKSLAYYLHSVDADGDSGVSPAEMFKLIGVPKIKKITRRK